MPKSILYLTTNDIGNPIRGCDRRSYQLYHWVSTWASTSAISYNKADTGPSNVGEKPHHELDYPRTAALAPINPVVFYRLLRQRLAPAQHVDIVIASGMGSLVYAIFAKFLFGASLIVDCHNVESQLSRELGEIAHYIFSLTVERTALRLANLVLVTSARDRQQFRESIQSKAIIVANGYDQSIFYADGRETKNQILFFGNMNYPPNREAVEIIVDRIAPAVSESEKDLRIHIAGPHCEHIRPLVDEINVVQVVGLVDDIAEYIRDSTVVIVPLRTGSGTRLKIIESLACGTPVVSTPKGAEGWPRTWTSLKVTELDSFPEVLLETVDHMGAPTETELEEFQAYTWERQIANLKPYLLESEGASPHAE